MTCRPLRIAVIIGSTREGRVGAAVGEWAAARVRQHDDVRAHVLDLADFAFPASYPEHATEQMATFTSEIARADGFVVVTPEYNRSYPASLKQAIDYAYDEWQAKPVGFVSYGHRSGGMYAVEHLRCVFTELHTVTMRTSVSFNLLDDRPLEADGAVQTARTMLDQLSWWATALRVARTARPYVS